MKRSRDLLDKDKTRKILEQLNQPKTSHSQGESQDNNKINNGGQNGN